ncbi:MAG: hypothetical protein RLY71_100 [Pseudomonadota bacterium]|jgi:DNA-binding response OmpR family regulator
MDTSAARADRTVLVIDDSRVVRDLAANLLKKDGYRVLQAANGREGLELARQARPDIAICDINMPVLDGWGFVAEVRACESLATLQVLMMTARSDRESVRRAMASGADDYLTKPWKPAELRGAVHALDGKLTRQQAHTERSLNRLRGAILATVPHELRTPLTSILGLSQLLITRRDRYPEARMTEMLQSVHDSANRLARTIARMMDWAELTAAATTSAPTSSAAAAHAEPLDPAAQVAQLLSAPAFRAEVLAALCQPAPPDLPGQLAGRPVQVRLTEGHICCAATDFRHMLTELLANAVRFSRPDLPIGVTGQMRDSQVYVIEIANIGAAMPAEFVHQIGALSQAGRDQHEQQGAGLGLALTQLRARRNQVSLEIPRSDGLPTIVRLVFRMAG